MSIHEIKFIKKFLGIHEIKCINSECKGMYTHLIDKLSSLVRYINPGSSIIADKLIHELGHTFSTFPYQRLRLNKFTCVVYAGDNGVVPLWSLRQVGDEIDANLSPGFNVSISAYLHPFQMWNQPSHIGMLHGCQQFALPCVLCLESKLWMTIGRLFYPFQSGHSLPWPQLLC